MTLQGPAGELIDIDHNPIRIARKIYARVYNYLRHFFVYFSLW